MKTYDEALQEIQQIVNDLQAGKISIDELSEQVRKASELIQYCKNKLRKTSLELEQLLADADQ